ncbi:uncharacterized protein LOC128234213 isoform X2 [Mya arenaria]|nr:uncharacterized protein LOC128234213 isoform X2 [Mya arenaria]
MRLGIISPEVLNTLEEKYSDDFIIDKERKSVCLHEKYKTERERTDAFRRLLTDMREKEVFRSFKGWRNETYGIYYKRHEAPIFHVERSSCAVFGFTSYGVHINGYTYRDGKIMMWVGRRSPTKPTFPNMLDNMCAGGLASGLGVMECAIKECREEASVDDETLKSLRPAGAVSYCYRDHRGILPETEYVFDLEVSPDFVPRSADGEMEQFYLHSLEEIQSLIINEEFKPNCAMVTVDFMIRRGLIAPDEEPNYSYLVERMHVNLQPPC